MRFDASTFGSKSDRFRMVSSIFPAVMFGVCTLLLMVYQINKRRTLQIATDLAERRDARATK